MNRVPFRFREAAPLIKVACRNWQHDKAPRMGAALAYYIALSLAPALVILLAITHWALGRGGTGGRFVPQIQDLVGYDGARALQTMIEGAPQSSGGIAATALGLVTVFLAASAVVSELRDAMDTIWKVPPDKRHGTGRGFFQPVKERIVSFVLVLASGLFLVASLIVNTWIFAAGKFLNSGSSLPGSVVQVTDWILSFLVITALFAFIFKVLPRVPLRWGDVAVGAVGTALLFVVGKILLGVYLGKAGFANTYGAAGSLVIVLVWVYYSAQVLFLGAEFTRAYTHRFGSMFAPKNDHSGL